MSNTQHPAGKGIPISGSQSIYHIIPFFAVDETLQASFEVGLRTYNCTLARFG